MTDSREPQRDTNVSSFGEILKSLCERFGDIETAVFYDDLGETIDYYSFQDPFQTRLLAAHWGLVFAAVRTRLRWLGMGATDMIEVRMSGKEIVTKCVSEESFLTLVLAAGGIDEKLLKSIANTISSLRDEAGY